MEVVLGVGRDLDLEMGEKVRMGEVMEELGEVLGMVEEEVRVGLEAYSSLSSFWAEVHWR